MKRLQNKLVLLTLVAGCSLLAIILLQLSWLRGSYREEEKRFLSDVENALFSTLLMEKLNNSVDSSDRAGLVSGIVNMASTVMADAPLIAQVPDVQINALVDTVAPAQLHTTSREELLSVLRREKGKDSSRRIVLHVGSYKAKGQAPTLAQYRQQLSVQLKKYRIGLPFELAFVSRSGQVREATTDPEKFKAIPVKTSLEGALPATPDKKAVLQAAFPDASLYLLRRMSLVLGLSVALILLCCTSLVYLITLFFRQKRLSDIRNDLISNMTHELKTPIASATLALELLDDERREMTEQEKLEYYAIARGELARLHALVEKALQVSAFDHGGIGIHRESFAAGPWLDDIVRSFKPIFDKNRVRFSKTIAPEDLQLYADKQQTANVLQNLIENAVKYNDKTNPELQISITGEPEGVLMTISDNGRGIPEVYQDKIFDKFFRVPEGNLHTVKGYGLGLSYARSVVELQGGSVHVKSREGSGSSFRIFLPKQKPQA